MIGFKETATVVLLTAGLILGHAAEAAGTNNKSVATYSLGEKGPLGWYSLLYR